MIRHLPLPISLILASLLLQLPAMAAGATAIESISVQGNPTLVFDYRRDKQERWHVADAPPAAWREADGTVNLLTPHPETYRMRGPSLEELSVDPHKVYSSKEQGEEVAEEQFNYDHWLTAPYTLDGKQLYALSHTEWYACMLANDCGDRNSRLGGWTTTNNLFRSDDGGRSWATVGKGRQHLVFDGAARWSGSKALTDRVYRRGFNVSGMMVPSRPIREGDYFYTAGAEIHRDLTKVEAKSGVAPIDMQGVLLLRTRDLSRSDGWQVWAGESSFKPARVENAQPFLPRYQGRPLRASRALLLHDTHAQLYIMFFTVWSNDPGYYYVTTPSLAAPSWSEARLVIGSNTLSMDPAYTPAYTPADAACNRGIITTANPAVIDSDSPGLNFEFTNGDPWLFYVVNHARCGKPRENMNRDIYRVRLRIDYRPQP